MDKIANTTELQAELLKVLATAKMPNPERTKVAQDLRALADRLVLGSDTLQDNLEGIEYADKWWQSYSAGVDAIEDNFRATGMLKFHALIKQPQYKELDKAIEELYTVWEEGMKKHLKKIGEIIEKSWKLASIKEEKLEREHAGRD